MLIKTECDLLAKEESIKELDLSFVTLEHLESKDFLFPDSQITMFDYFHKLPRCTICRNIGFLPRDPLPAKKLTKIEQRRKTKSIEKAKKLRNDILDDNYDSVYDSLISFRPRTLKKILQLLLQASNLSYLLFECTKCRVTVHSKCCGGSFPTLDVESIKSLLVSTVSSNEQFGLDFLKVVR